MGIGIEQEPRLTRCWLGLVDLVGIEPTTSSMPWKRAPSCATGPRLAGQLFYCRGLRPVRQTRGDSPGLGSGPARARPIFARAQPLALHFFKLLKRIERSGVGAAG